MYSEEEIRMMISRSHEEGQLDQVESELIDNVFNFVDRMAKEVMVPRQDVDCVFVEDGYDEAMKVIRSKVHTRYPLCVEDKDHIIGLVHIKDLMERPNQARKDLRNIKRDILTVPEVMKLSTLLQYMRTRRIYLAVVVDEYGGMVGLVGLEDIIEEFKTYLEDMYLLFEQEYKNVENPDSPENIAHIYGQCRNISIDFGIMEKSVKVYVMKGEFGWSDVGTWHSFHEISPKDENNNVSNSEQVRLIETKECIINVPQDKKVIIEGIENCIIAENNDILMICHRDHEDNIRHFDDMLKHTTKELN